MVWSFQLPFITEPPCIRWRERLTEHGVVWGRPLPAASGRKRLECPRCRVQCAVKGGRAAELPTNYDVMGA